MVSEIGECSNMTQLDLQHNDLIELPDSIGKLKHLIRFGIRSVVLLLLTVFFRYNKLRSLPRSLENCSLLEEFIIEGNHLQSLPVSPPFPSYLTSSFRIIC